jgi:hypothetical protein
MVPRVGPRTAGGQSDGGAKAALVQVNNADRDHDLQAIKAFKTDDGVGLCIRSAI